MKRIDEVKETRKYTEATKKKREDVRLEDVDKFKKIIKREGLIPNNG